MPPDLPLLRVSLLTAMILDLMSNRTHLNCKTGTKFTWRNTLKSRTQIMSCGFSFSILGFLRSDLVLQMKSTSMSNAFSRSQCSPSSELGALAGGRTVVSACIFGSNSGVLISSEWLGPHHSVVQQSQSQSQWCSRRQGMPSMSQRK